MNSLRLAVLGAACLLGATAGFAADLAVLVTDQRGRPLADAVVLATPADPRSLLHAKVMRDAVDQVDKQFVPYVKVVYAGSRVRFPNKDNIRHQVYSFSKPKRFELPLYAGSEAPPVSFDQIGVVVLGCNIHDWMLGYIYVADTPFFAKTDSLGTAMLSDLPGGEYSVRIWHPSMEQPEDTTIKHVTLGVETPDHVAWQLAVKAALRIPRVSGDAAPGYP